MVILAFVSALSAAEVTARPVQSQAENRPAANEGAPKLVIDTGGFTSRVNSIDFSPRGDVVAAAGSDKVVRLWDVATGRLIQTLRGYDDDAGYGMCQVVQYSPDGGNLLVGVQDLRGEGAIRVYDTGNLAEIQSLLPGHPNGGVIRLAFSRDGRYLASGGADGGIIFWDWTQKRPIGQIAWTANVNYFGFATAIGILVIHDAQGIHLLSARNAREVSLLTVEEQLELASPEVFGPACAAAQELGPALGEIAARLPNQARSNLVRYYPARGSLKEDHALFASSEKKDGHDAYSASLWTLSGRSVQQYEDHPYVISAVALGIDGLVAASADELGNIDLWSTTTGKLRFRLVGQGQTFYHAGFDSSGTRLVFGTQPFGPDRWNYNSFAAPDRSFDLSKRTFSSAPAAVREPPRQATGDRQLRLGKVASQQSFVMTSQRQGLIESTHPLPPGVAPLFFGYLGNSRTGISDLLMIGSNDNTLVGLDPSNPIRTRAFIGHSGAVYAGGSSPDGRFLVSGSADRTLRIWSLGRVEDFAFLDFDVYGNGIVFSLSPGGSAERAGIRAGDQLIRIGGRDLGSVVERMMNGNRDYRPGQRVAVDLTRGGQPISVEIEMVAIGDIVAPLLNLFVAGDEWVLWTPSGYYDASLGGDRLIGWHVNRGRDRAARFYTAHQFRKQFYRPDVIDKILEIGETARGIDLANQATVHPKESLDLRRPEDFRKVEPPLVKVEEPRSGTHVQGKTVKVRAEVMSQNGESIDDVKVLVNGRSVTGKGLAMAAGDTDITRAVRIDVELDAGRNNISVLATNLKSKASSRPQEIIVYRDFADSDEDEKPRAFVLAVGISEYANAEYRLEFAHTDALAFAAVWGAQAGTLYSAVQTRVLINAKATVAAVREGFDWLNNSVRPKDYAIIFIAAHGVGDASRGYFIASHELNTRRLISTAIPDRDLISLAEGLRCRRTLVFLDTCHAGGIENARRNSSESLRELVSDEVGAIMFGACKPRESSQEDPSWGHGAFTKALLETFGDPSKDQPPPDGLLSIEELSFPLSRRVASLTDNEQHTVVSRPPTMENFDFYAFVGAAKPSGPGRPAEPGGSR